MYTQTKNTQISLVKRTFLTNHNLRAENSSLYRNLAHNLLQILHVFIAHLLQKIPT
jgi:hypothetical protein